MKDHSNENPTDSDTDVVVADVEVALTVGDDSVEVGTAVESRVVVAMNYYYLEGVALMMMMMA